MNINNNKSKKQLCLNRKIIQNKTSFYNIQRKRLMSNVTCTLSGGHAKLHADHWTKSLTVHQMPSIKRTVNLPWLLSVDWFISMV